MSATLYIEIFGKLWLLSLDVKKLGHNCKQNIAPLTTSSVSKKEVVSSVFRTYRVKGSADTGMA